MGQLKTNIGSIDIKLSAEAVQDINSIHDITPNPCP
jgi:aryl-alcohol dehydrogenase-like predicted oxidoreductase